VPWCQCVTGRPISRPARVNINFVPRTAFASPKAVVGSQPETIGETRLWVLPNPSGLNAHWQLPYLAEEFRRLRAAVPRR